MILAGICMIQRDSIHSTRFSGCSGFFRHISGMLPGCFRFLWDLQDSFRIIAGISKSLVTFLGLLQEICGIMRTNSGFSGLSGFFFRIARTLMTYPGLFKDICGLPRIFPGFSGCLRLFWQAQDSVRIFARFPGFPGFLGFFQDFFLRDFQDVWDSFNMRRIPSGYLRVFKDFPGFSGFLQDCFMLDYQDALRIFCGIFRIWKSLTTFPEFLQNICGIFGMLSGFLQDFQDSFRILSGFWCWWILSCGSEFVSSNPKWSDGEGKKSCKDFFRPVPEILEGFMKWLEKGIGRWAPPPAPSWSWFRSNPSRNPRHPDPEFPIRSNDLGRLRSSLPDPHCQILSSKSISRIPSPIHRRFWSNSFEGGGGGGVSPIELNANPICIQVHSNQSKSALIHSAIRQQRGSRKRIKSETQQQKEKDATAKSDVVQIDSELKSNSIRFDREKEREGGREGGGGSSI